MGAHNDNISVGDTIRTQFVRGVVKRIINGKEKGWSNVRYFLIQPQNFAAHWVKETEIPYEPRGWASTI